MDKLGTDQIVCFWSGQLSCFLFHLIHWARSLPSASGGVDYLKWKFSNFLRVFLLQKGLSPFLKKLNLRAADMEAEEWREIKKFNGKKLLFGESEIRGSRRDGEKNNLKFYWAFKTFFFLLSLSSASLVNEMGSGEIPWRKREGRICLDINLLWRILFSARSRDFFFPFFLMNRVCVGGWRCLVSRGKFFRFFLSSLVFFIVGLQFSLQFLGRFP